MYTLKVRLFTYFEYINVKLNVKLYLSLTLLFPGEVNTLYPQKMSQIC